MARGARVFGRAGSLAARALPGRLQRHVLDEFLRALALSTCVFTGFFVLMTALSLEGQARKFGTDVATLAGAMPYLLPYMLCFSLPLAFLVAGVLAFGRLEGSGEVAAMRASGVRLTTVTGPVLALALVFAGPVVFLADTGMRWGFARAEARLERSGRAAILGRAASGTTFRIDTSERSYRIHRFGRGPDGREPLAVVEFRDGAPREVVLARDHRLDARSGPAPPEAGASDASGEADLDFLRFRMGEGGETGAPEDGFAWARILRPGEVILARSGEFTIATEGTSRRRKGMFSREFAVGLSENVREAKRLREEIERPGPGMTEADDARAPRAAKEKRLRVVEMEIHRKLSFAFGPLALLLLGIPLGIRLGRGGRVTGFIVGVAVIAVFYYPLWFSGQGLATAGKLPASVSVWMANAAAGAVGAVWLSRMT